MTNRLQTFLPYVSRFPLRNGFQCGTAFNDRGRQRLRTPSDWRNTFLSRKHLREGRSRALNWNSDKVVMAHREWQSEKARPIRMLSIMPGCSRAGDRIARGRCAWRPSHRDATRRRAHRVAGANSSSDTGVQGVRAGPAGDLGNAERVTLSINPAGGLNPPSSPATAAVTPTNQSNQQ